jgi:aminoglycoside phosphotransferase (APT) family kinase protein
MHADESDIDVDLVRRLLAEQFPQWADLPIEPVASSGTVNALYRLGSRMAVRLPRVGLGAEDAEREHRWLPKLAPLLPVTIPVPLGRGTPSLGYPGHWSVYRWLEGETPTPEQVTDKLATDLAAFVSAVRRIGLEGGPAALPRWASDDPGRFDA